VAVFVVALLTIFGLLAIVLAVPAYALRGRRGDWRGFTIWCGKGLLVATSLLIVGQFSRVRHEQPSGLVRSLQEGRLTIPAFLRAERATAPATFDRRLVDAQGRALRELALDVSGLALSGITENDRWIRAHMTYRIAPSAENGDVGLNGHLILYYHPAGMAALGAVCSDERTSCARLEGLLANSEQSLRLRLGAADLDGVLPESEQCSVEAVQLPDIDQGQTVRVCPYDPGVQLTLTRVDATATIAGLVAERIGR